MSIKLSFFASTVLAAMLISVYPSLYFFFTATTYHVDQVLGNDANTCVQAQSAATPKATIAGGYSCMTTGQADTLIIHAGTYSEHLTIAKNGQDATHLLTFQANAGDLVTMQGFSIGAQNFIALGGSAANTGLTMQGPSSMTTSLLQFTGNATNILIQNNDIGGQIGSNNGGLAGQQCLHIVGAPTTFLTSVSLINDKFHGCGTDNSTTPYKLAAAVQAFGPNWLFLNLQLSHLSDGLTPNGANYAILRNTFGSVSCADIGEPNGGSGSSCDQTTFHVDPWLNYDPASGNVNTYLVNILIEGNTTNGNLGPNGHGMGLLQSDGTAGNARNAILRYNVTNNTGTTAGYLDNAGYGCFPYVAEYNQTYANAIQNVSEQNVSIASYSSGPPGNCTSSAFAPLHTMSLNNLIYNAVSNGGVATFTDTTTGGTHTCKNNLMFNSGYSGSWPNPVGATCTGVITNQDPLLVNGTIAAFDPHYQGGSPAIGAGAAQSAVDATDTGSGVTLVLTDSTPFQAGGTYCCTVTVPGDWIVDTTNGNTGQIVAVSADHKTVTLAAGFARANGDGIALWKLTDGTPVMTAGAGQKPNIGFATSAAPVPSVSSFSRTADILTGAGAILNLATSNADTCTVTGVGSIPCNGSLTVNPSQNTCYSGTASGPGGTATFGPVCVFVGIPRGQVNK